MKKLISFLCCVLIAIVVDAQQRYFRNYSLAEGLPQSEANAIFYDSRGVLWVGTNGGGLCRFNGREFQCFTDKEGLPSNLIVHIAEDRSGNLWISTLKGIAKYDGLTFTKFGAKEGFPDGQVYAIYEDKTENGKMWFFSSRRGKTGTLLYLEKGKLKSIRNDLPQQFPDSVGLGLAFWGKNNIYVASKQALLEFDGKNFKPSALKKDFFVLPRFEDKDGFLWATVFEAPQTAGKLYRYKNGNYELIKTPDDFLSNAITGVYQAQNGDMWFVTSGQVFKYDGQNFTTFSNKNGLSQGFALKVTGDKENNIWIAMRGSGILRYSGDRFTAYTMKEGLKSDMIRAVFQDSKGVFWFGLESNAISKYDGLTATNYSLDENALIGLVVSIKELENGNLIIGTDNGLFEFDGTKATAVNEKYGIDPKARVLAILKTKDSSLWFSVINQGIARYKDGKTTIFEQKELGYINHLWEGKNGRIWIGSDVGLSYLEDGKFTIMGEEQGAKRSPVLQMTEDKFGNYWLVQYAGDGLVRYDGKKFRYYTKSNTKISSDLLYSIITDKNGDLWLGTQVGVDKITVTEKGDIANIRSYGKLEGFMGVETNGYANFVDRDNNIWFGTIGGAMKYNPTQDFLVKNAPIVNINQLKLFFRDKNWTSEESAKLCDSVSAWTNLPQNLRLPADSNHVSFDFEAIQYSAPEKVRFQWKLNGADRDWLPLSDKSEAVYANLAAGRYTFMVRAINEQGIWSDNPATFTFEISPPWWQTWWARMAGMGAVFGFAFSGFRWRIRLMEARRKVLERLVKERTAEVEKQKHEILEKNTELEQQQEEIIAQHDRISEQHRELDHKNKAITSSINYAKRIQDAMLPIAAQMKQHLPEHFVFFKPRDIVSGDFYWFHEIEAQQKTIIAVIDCTGHGVPGAFMSLIGDTLLNQIVDDKHIYEPDLILNEMHKGVRGMLKQDTSLNRDGMDMTICVIDRKNHSVAFAGAKNSLVYLQNNQLFEIKGNKMPVGGEQLEEERIFDKHIVPLNGSPTTFYMFSDGYQDQFGGTERKKFMVKRMKEIFVEIHQQPMPEQQKILAQTLEEWMGTTYKQVDDILVMGIRL